MLIDYLEKLAQQQLIEGFWKYYHRLRNSDIVVNHKRLHRVYKAMKLPLRRRTKKRLPSRVKERLEAPEGFTHIWSIDFMTDVLSNGTRLRSFNVIDDYNREVLFVEVDYSLKSSRVIWVLRHLINRYGNQRRYGWTMDPSLLLSLLNNGAQQTKSSLNTSNLGSLHKMLM